MSTLKRRDLIEACKLGKVTLEQINKGDPTGQMALAYLMEKRAGDTDVDFDTWLDEDLDVEDVEDEELDPS
jgi:hypothetical protein